MMYIDFGTLVLSEYILSINGDCVFLENRIFLPPVEQRVAPENPAQREMYGETIRPAELLGSYVGDVGPVGQSPTDSRFLTIVSYPLGPKHEPAHAWHYNVRITATRHLRRWPTYFHTCFQRRLIFNFQTEQSIYFDPTVSRQAPVPCTTH